MWRRQERKDIATELSPWDVIGAKLSTGEVHSYLHINKKRMQYMHVSIYIILFDVRTCERHSSFNNYNIN